MLTYDEKCRLIRDAKPGDVWVNRKTGKKIKILAHFYYKLKCQHESGRITYKQHHYFAGDNDPME